MKKGDYVQIVENFSAGKKGQVMKVVWNDEGGGIGLLNEETGKTTAHDSAIKICLKKLEDINS